MSNNDLDYLTRDTKIIISDSDKEYSVTLKNGLGGLTEDVFEAVLGLMIAAGHHPKSIDDIIVERAYEIEPQEEVADEQPSFVEELLERYPRIHQHGFTHGEMEHILKFFPKINMEAYNNAMMCNTGMIIENDFITYPTDFRTGLFCGLEGREATIGEWD